MAYRDAATPKQPIAIVRYRPLNLFTQIGLVAFILAMSFFTLFQALTFARTSHLECERGGAHACVIVREYGPLTTHQTFPLNQINNVVVKSHSGKNRTTYSVALQMTYGAEQILRAGDKSYAELTRKVVADFVEGRAVSPSKIPLDASSPITAGFMSLFSIAIGLASFLVLGSARLEVDLDRSTVKYVRSRFPRRPVTRTLRAEEIHAARVTSRPGSKGGTIYGVSLDLADGEVLELVPGGGGNKKRPEVAAAEFNALLARMKSA